MPVQNTADQQTKGGVVRGYSKGIENGKVEYEVQAIVNGHGRDITIAPDGNLIEIEEQVSFDRREITSRDWSGYPILTFPDVPSIEVVLMERSDPSLGAGEGSLPPTSAALANAFTHATGRRLRELPMTPERVKTLLS